jgi:hypothetical protein
MDSQEIIKWKKTFEHTQLILQMKRNNDEKENEGRKL